MTQPFEKAMAAFAPALPLAVGLSGGADSTALLIACVQRWPGQVSAVHVNHGLQAAAGLFESHCAALCARLGVALRVQQVNAQPAPGQSPEDAARIARYKAFEAVALAGQARIAIKTIALAQHADDQVETLLLALSRGAGLPGLAAMPAQWQRAGLQWARPLLAVAGADVRAWLQARGETWVEDPSNQNQGFTRNRIRAQLLPALEATFPGFRDTFARSSAHAAQAQQLLAELAQADLLEVGNPPVISALQRLSSARQANLLRHWLRVSHRTAPSTAQLHELQRQIAACTTRGHRIEMRVGSGFVRRSNAHLDWYNPTLSAP